MSQCVYGHGVLQTWTLAMVRTSLESSRREESNAPRAAPEFQGTHARHAKIHLFHLPCTNLLSPPPTLDSFRLDLRKFLAFFENCARIYGEFSQHSTKHSTKHSLWGSHLGSWTLFVPPCPCSLAHPPSPPRAPTASLNRGACVGARARVGASWHGVGGQICLFHLSHHLFGMQLCA